MTEPNPRRHGALGRRLGFLVLWLLAQGIGAVAILMAAYFSLWVVPGLGMADDLADWVFLSALFGTPPLMAVAMVASLVLAIRGRRRGALIVLVPAYFVAAIPFAMA